MPIKKLILVIGLSILFAGCSTSGYYGDNFSDVTHVSPGTMGVRYLLGRGVHPDDKQAFYYFNKAAHGDDPFAENELAYLYAAGKGTQQNYQQAFAWYQKAAEHGLASAQYNLGLMYIHGLGTTPNRALGMEWIKKAAAHGFEPAQQLIQ
jgi:TPR repeat protein